jgi:hypothetical protein
MRAVNSIVFLVCGVKLNVPVALPERFLREVKGNSQKKLSLNPSCRASMGSSLKTA